MVKVSPNESYDEFKEELNRIVIGHTEKVKDKKRANADILTAFIEQIACALTTIDTESRMHLMTSFAANVVMMSEAKEAASKSHVPANDLNK